MSGRVNLHYLCPLVLFEFLPHECIIFKVKLVKMKEDLNLYVLIWGKLKDKGLGKKADCRTGQVLPLLKKKKICHPDTCYI